MLITREAAGNYTAQGMGLHLPNATIYNRTLIDTPTCRDTLIEQRAYIHRNLSSLLVYEILASPSSGHWDSWAGCSLTIDWNLSTSTPDLTAPSPMSSSDDAVTVWSRKTLVPEYPDIPVRTVGSAFSSWILSAAHTHSLNFTQHTSRHSLFSTFRSDLDSISPAHDAQLDWVNPNKPIITL